MMTAGSILKSNCSLSLQELQSVAAIVEQDANALPERSTSILLRWEEPFVQPWWTPRTLSHDVPRHLVMFKNALVRFPWLTHFVKLDLDCYPWFRGVLPTLVRRPLKRSRAGKTGHVYLGMWKKMGFYGVSRTKGEVPGTFRRDTDCLLPGADGGTHGDKCRHWKQGMKIEWSRGAFFVVDYAQVNDAWCNEWSMTDYESGCFGSFDREALGRCSGFMYGPLWGVSASLLRAMVENRDPYMDKVLPSDYYHYDIRVGSWVSRVALKKREAVELRAVCDRAPWFHFSDPSAR